MGEQNVYLAQDPSSRQDIREHITRDIDALEDMVKERLLEQGVKRIGAEQELCVVDNSFQPSPKAEELLDQINDPHFTFEIAKFNLEINLDPLSFKGSCFSDMEKQLRELIDKGRKAAHGYETDLMMAGILPTIKKMDLYLHNLTPNERSRAMIKAMQQMRKQDYVIRINGIDELVADDFSIMFQSCNTSFQVHFQIQPDDFADQYNFAQLIAAPVLAASTNSPLLFGKRLWHETRIALFQQAVDTRRSSFHLTDEEMRVPFGSEWVEGTIADIFRRDLASYKIFLGSDNGEEVSDTMEEGVVPELKSLQVFNSSVFKWTRPCYGMTNGKPHLRIENRLLPAGPTTGDEIANAMFWTGLMNALPDRYRNLPRKMKFENAKINLLKAARYGLSTQFSWLNNEKISANDLLLNELLPLAHEGLVKENVEQKDINHYLSIIEGRVTSNQTGSKWILDSFEKMREEGHKDVILTGITAGLMKRQKENIPVHKWESLQESEISNLPEAYGKVRQIMTTRLHTVNEDDLVDLMAGKMIKHHVRHIPVENEAGQLVGIIDVFHLLTAYSMHAKQHNKALVAGEIMETDFVPVSPEKTTYEAIQLMKKNKINVLPVIQNDKLAGIITEGDLVQVASYFLENK